MRHAQFSQLRGRFLTDFLLIFLGEIGFALIQQFLIVLGVAHQWTQERRAVAIGIAHGLNDLLDGIFIGAALFQGGLQGTFEFTVILVTA